MNLLDEIKLKKINYHYVSESRLRPLLILFYMVYFLQNELENVSLNYILCRTVPTHFLNLNELSKYF